MYQELSQQNSKGLQQGQYNSPVVEKTPLEIPSSLKDQQDKINSLFGIFSELEKRLKPITRIEPSSDCEKEAVEPKPISVSSELRINNNHLQRLINRIQEQLRLLEL